MLIKHDTSEFAKECWVFCVTVIIVTGIFLRNGWLGNVLIGVGICVVVVLITEEIQLNFAAFIIAIDKRIDRRIEQRLQEERDNTNGGQKQC